MKVYKGIIKKRDQKRKSLILIAFGIFAFVAYTVEQYFYIPLIIVGMLAVFHEKEHIVSEKGVEIKRNMFGMRSDNLWTWDEITALQPDYIKFRPHAQLLIERDTTLRPFLFEPHEVEEIIEMAKQLNPNIYVDFVTAEEQEEINRRNEQYKMQQRDLREKEKANKKKKKKR